MPRIISTSFITGTGFIKCMPMKRSGREVTAAKLRDRDRAGVARQYHSGPRDLVQLPKQFRLRVKLFGHCLDRRSPPRRGPPYRLSALCARLSPASLRGVAAVYQRRAVGSCLWPKAALEELLCKSRITTSSPARAATCAMPLPIVPAPTTPIDSITSTSRILQLIQKRRTLLPLCQRI